MYQISPDREALDYYPFHLLNFNICRTGLPLFFHCFGPTSAYHIFAVSQRFYAVLSPTYSLHSLLLYPTNTLFSTPLLTAFGSPKVGTAPYFTNSPICSVSFNSPVFPSFLSSYPCHPSQRVVINNNRAEWCSNGSYIHPRFALNIHGSPTLTAHCLLAHV